MLSRLRRWFALPPRTASVSAQVSVTVALVLAMLTPLAARAEMTLLMVEQAGCVYCKQWDDEISAKYPRTEEGRAAPLRRVDLRAATPADVTLDRPAVFTPTFVLLRDGREVGRIEGYPGEDFFWGLLDTLLAQAMGG